MTRPTQPERVTPDAAAAYVDRDAALALLGVKPETLYTYVSRGWIRRVAMPGRRQSLYAREDVERIRARSHARSSDAVLAAGSIRYGEPIVPTSITELGPDGPLYRGRSAVELARAGFSYESVAELLWTGLLLDDPAWALEPLPGRVVRLARQLAAPGVRIGIHDAFAFMTLAAAMAGGGPRARMTDSASPAEAARQLILVLTGCFGILGKAGSYRPPRAGETVAAAIAASLGLAGTDRDLRALDAALILCADHELNPATFVARIGASSEGDLHACIVAAICASSGARIARACDRLEEFFRGPINADALAPRGAPHAAPGAQDVVASGFNHPLYPHGDPRGRCLLELVRARAGRSARVRTILAALDTAEVRHKQRPRIEAALAVMAIALRLPPGSAAGLYTLGRMAGWAAHIAEQRLGGFLIRPRAKFVGLDGG
jgi:citrate synthase